MGTLRFFLIGFFFAILSRTAFSWNRFPETDKPMLGTLFSFPIQTTSELGFGLKGQDFNLLLRAETLAGLGFEISWNRQLPTPGNPNLNTPDSFRFLFPLMWNSLEGWNAGLIPGFALGQESVQPVWGLEGGLMWAVIRIAISGFLVAPGDSASGTTLKNQIQIEYFFSRSTEVLGYAGVRFYQEFIRDLGDLSSDSNVAQESPLGLAFITGLRF